LAQELLKLSFKDRTELEEEIHGVRCGAATEKPVFLQHSLSKFDYYLNARKEKEPDNPVLRNVIRISSLDETAAKLEISKCYLNDPDIRLRFLRCDRFVPDKAVERMVNFLEFTAELFGDFVSDRQICLSDFNPKELIELQNSRTQYLPFRDRSGRRVLVHVGTCNFHLDVFLRMKILMYLNWVVSEDLETQRKGIVIVAWIFDEGEDTTWQTTLRPKMKSNSGLIHNKNYNSLPVRVTSIQHFYVQDTAFFRSMATLFVFYMEPQYRKFYKSYFGNQTELLYKLAGFGIPHDLLPISCTGNIKTANHHSWINFQRMRLLREKNHNGDEIVECPRSEDVVFKKGPGYRNNPGNLYFRGLIESAGNEHQDAGKGKKYQLTLRIVEQIEEINGRFLEWSKPKKMWVVNKDRNSIRTKVASMIKQYNRQRMESHQLKNTISTAGAVIASSPKAQGENQDEGGNSSGEEGSLKHHYSIQNTYDAKKRRKIAPCDQCVDPMNENDKLCFGKTFFPTNNTTSMNNLSLYPRGSIGSTTN